MKIEQFWKIVFPYGNIITNSQEAEIKFQRFLRTLRTISKSSTVYVIFIRE